ncbi:MAG: BrnA antitoxin family protein [Ahrensia sp.]|nr:BrnA antitoxin family protein [Ahrensia sp.]
MATVRMTIDPSKVVLTQEELDRIDAIKDEDIDYSDSPEWTEEDFANAMTLEEFNAYLAKRKQPKKSATIRYDADMLDWFKSHGKGYQTRMNAVLRAFYEAQLEKSAK